MEHCTYKVSEETRARLVNAAGELFSLRGVEAVTVREIADLAGAVPNAVRYHFGDKEGLVEAVREYALRLWDDGRIERYYQKNESLLATRDGSRQMVADTIDLYYGILCAEGQPRWVIRLLLRAQLTSQWQGKRHVHRPPDHRNLLPHLRKNLGERRPHDRRLLGDDHHRPRLASGDFRIRLRSFQGRRQHRLHFSPTPPGNGHTQRPSVAWA